MADAALSEAYILDPFPLFGAELNAFLPLYVAAAVLAGVALAHLDAADLALLAPATPVRAIGGTLVLIGAVAVPVDLTGAPEVGTPQRLFELGSAVGVDVLNRYDVSADGQRFLTIDSVQGSGSEVIVMLDWEARLAER